MMTVLMNEPDEFAAKDQPLTREQLDLKDYKPFWTTKAVLFNDPNFKTIIFKEATADLKEFVEKPDFEEGGFMHKAKKTRIAMIERNLAQLTEI